MSFENLLMVMKYSFEKSARARKQLHCGRFGSTYVLRVFVRAITSLANFVHSVPLWKAHLSV